MILLGDIHGNFQCIVNFCYKNELKEPLTLIQVGDFGAGFSSEFVIDMEHLNDTLSEYNVTLYAIRGNHDDPHYFNGEYEWSNIKLLKDYTVLVLEGKKILFVGGAISIDRLQRTENRSWWRGEEFVFDPDRLAEYEGIDIVVTHNAPWFAYPSNFNNLVMSFAAYDLTLLDDLTRERGSLTEMFNILKEKNNIKHWFYGHFHATKVEIHNDINFNLLGINSLYYL